MRTIILSFLCTIFVAHNIMLTTQTPSKIETPHEYPFIPKTVPYLVSLQINAVHFCGGCLITKEHVLSSAQCIIEIIKRGGFNFINATAVVDLTDLSENGTIYHIENVHHYYYTETNRLHFKQQFNVGLVLLKTCIIESDRVRPIPLTELGCRGGFIADLAGWKFVKPLDLNQVYDESCMPDKLKIIQIRLENLDVCDHFYGKNKIQDTLTCGSDRYKTVPATLADSGTPLVHFGKVLAIATSIDHDPIIFVRASFINLYIEKAKNYFLENFPKEKKTIANKLPKRDKKSDEHPITDTNITYMVSLQINAVHFCCGCLITQEHVLSSARCIIHIIKYGGHNFINVTAVVDVTDLSQEGIIHQIADVHHYQYSKTNKLLYEQGFDVGLILLENRVIKSNTVHPIPVTKFHINVGNVADLAGWKLLKPLSLNQVHNETRTHGKLRKIQIELENDDDCNKVYGFTTMPKSLICGRDRDKKIPASLAADPGTPLVLNGEVIAITAFIDNDPIVFVRATYIYIYVEKTKIYFRNTRAVKTTVNG